MLQVKEVIEYKEYKEYKTRQDARSKSSWIILYKE